MQTLLSQQVYLENGLPFDTVHEPPSPAVYGPRVRPGV